MPGFASLRLVSWVLTGLAGNATGPTIGGPPAGIKAVTIAIKADPGNAATAFIGGGGIATFPLVKDEGVVMDAPPGMAFDVSELTVDGHGTAGLIVHVLAAIPE